MGEAIASLWRGATHGIWLGVSSLGTTQGMMALRQGEGIVANSLPHQGFWDFSALMDVFFPHGLADYIKVKSPMMFLLSLTEVIVLTIRIDLHVQARRW